MKTRDVWRIMKMRKDTITNLTLDWAQSHNRRLQIFINPCRILFFFPFSFSLFFYPSGRISLSFSVLPFSFYIRSMYFRYIRVYSIWRRKRIAWAWQRWCLILISVIVWMQKMASFGGRCIFAVISAAPKRWHSNTIVSWF